MTALGWKYYSALFATISGLPVFFYWYYGLPSVIDRYTDEWMFQAPKKDTSEFRELLKDLSERRQKLTREELMKKVAEEEKKRSLLK